jgi:SAM-dependent methyltransferase
LSGFDAAWLALREPADQRARDRALVAPLGAWLAARVNAGSAHIIDLGCGSGANRRFLAPLLPVRQRWTCVDDDAALLRMATAEVHDGHASEGLLLDLARIEALPTRRALLITASALLDLVSRPWLARLLAPGVRGHAALLFALNHDHMSFAPAHPDDVLVAALFEAHQGRDKGLGPALGARAGAAVTELLADSGLEVRRARSDWQLDAGHAGDAALLAPLLSGIARAAIEQRPDERARVDTWLAARTQQLRKGMLRARIGHEDLLALPPGQ